MKLTEQQRLTQEQIEKAAQAAWKRATLQPGWMGISDSWEQIDEPFKQQWRDLAIAAAPHSNTHHLSTPMTCWKR